MTFLFLYEIDNMKLHQQHVGSQKKCELSPIVSSRQQQSMIQTFSHSNAEQEKFNMAQSFIVQHHKRQRLLLKLQTRLSTHHCQTTIKGIQFNRM